MAKVIKRSADVIGLSEMKDGDVAEIVQWHDSHIPVGTVIQRYNESAIVIGEARGKCYPSIFGGEDLENIKVILLPKGTTIVL